MPTPDPEAGHQKTESMPHPTTDGLKGDSGAQDTQRGADMVARRIMERAADRKLCRMIIVNKIDAEDVNLEQSRLS